MSSPQIKNTMSGYEHDDVTFEINETAYHELVDSSSNTHKTEVKLQPKVDEDSTATDDFKSVAGNEDASSTQISMTGDRLCRGATTCVANSGDYRKVVSHFFGRNKKCTRQVPDECWVKSCRKHYQRMKYRGEADFTWHYNQLNLVRQQLEDFEQSGNIRDWTITLRKAELELINAENAEAVADTNPKKIKKDIHVADKKTPISSSVSTASQVFDVSDATSATTRTTPADNMADQAPSLSPEPNIKDEHAPTVTMGTAADGQGRAVSAESDILSSVPSHTFSAFASNDQSDDQSSEVPTLAPVWERFLVPYLGKSKNYADVREVLDVIEEEFDSDEFMARDAKKKVFPGVEFLPNVTRNAIKKAIKVPAKKRSTKAQIASQVTKRDDTKAGDDTTNTLEGAPTSFQPLNKPASRKRKASDADLIEADFDDSAAALPVVAPTKRRRTIKEPTAKVQTVPATKNPKVAHEAPVSFQPVNQPESRKRKASDVDLPEFDADEAAAASPMAASPKKRLVPKEPKPLFSELYH